MNLAIGIALAAMAVCLIAEILHARRVRRVARLAFGPGGRPRAWTRGVVPARVLGCGLLAWGFAYLALSPPHSRRPSEMPEGGFRHLLLVLDVSPSMLLQDAGPDGSQTRRRRAHDVLMSIFSRVALDQMRISVIAFYQGAKPVVIDTYDLEVVRNILNDLPLDQAFDIGKTRILDGLRQGFEIAHPWQSESTVLFLVSDGDTVPDQGMPEKPRSIARSLVIGVGDSRAGKFIDGHQSRQDAFTLRQIAARLGGSYHDVNEQHLPSEELALLAKEVPMARNRDGFREAALVAVGVGCALLVLIPIGLAVLGSTRQSASPMGRPGDASRVTRLEDGSRLEPARR